MKANRSAPRRSTRIRSSVTRSSPSSPPRSARRSAPRRRSTTRRSAPRSAPRYAAPRYAPIRSTTRRSAPTSSPTSPTKRKRVQVKPVSTIIKIPKSLLGSTKVRIPKSLLGSTKVRFLNPKSKKSKENILSGQGVLKGFQFNNESSVGNGPENEQRVGGKNSWKQVVKELERQINTYISQYDNKYKCALLNKSKVRDISDNIQGILRKKGFNSERRFLTAMLAFYTTNDYNNENYTRPLSFIIFGEVIVKENNTGKEKEALQILFGLTPDEHRSKALTVNLDGRPISGSLNYHLRLILLSIAKLYKKDYVTTEAVAWASQRQSEKLGFRVLTSKQYINPVNNTYKKVFHKIPIRIIESYFRGTNTPNIYKGISNNNIQEYASAHSGLTREQKQMLAFVMKYKDTENHKKSLSELRNTAYEDSTFAGVYGATYGGNAKGLNGKYTPGHGYVPKRRGFLFSHFFDVKRGNYRNNPYWNLIEQDFRNRREVEQSFLNLLMSNNNNMSVNNRNNRSSSSS